MLKAIAILVLVSVAFYGPMMYGFYLIHPGLAWIMASVFIGINLWHHLRAADKKAEEAERAKKREAAERLREYIPGLRPDKPEKPHRPC